MNLLPDQYTKLINAAYYLLSKMSFRMICFQFIIQDLGFLPISFKFYSPITLQHNSYFYKMNHTTANDMILYCLF